VCAVCPTLWRGIRLAHHYVLYSLACFFYFTLALCQFSAPFFACGVGTGNTTINRNLIAATITVKILKWMAVNSTSIYVQWETSPLVDAPVNVMYVG